MSRLQQLGGAASTKPHLQMHRQVMMRCAVQIRSVCTVGCPTVSLFPLFKTNQAVFRAVSGRLVDDYQQMSWCLGLHTCVSVCVYVCVCVCAGLHAQAEFWLWSLLKKRQASLIPNIERGRNKIRSQCFLNCTSSKLDGRMLLT